MSDLPRCPVCNVVLELHDTMDAWPPIPYSAWPERWHVSDGEGGARSECAECGAFLDGTQVAAAAGLPGYPWTRKDGPRRVRVEGHTQGGITP